MSSPQNLQKCFIGAAVSMAGAGPRGFNFGADDGRFNGWSGGARAFDFGGNDLVGMIVALEIYDEDGGLSKSLAVGFKESRRVGKYD